MSGRYEPADHPGQVIDELTNGFGCDDQLRSALEEISSLRFSAAPEPSGQLAELIMRGIPGLTTSEPRKKPRRRGERILLGALILSALGFSASGAAFAADEGFRRETASFFAQLMSPTPVEKSTQVPPLAPGQPTNPERPHHIDERVTPRSAPPDDPRTSVTNPTNSAHSGSTAARGSTSGGDSGDTQQLKPEPGTDSYSGPAPSEPDSSSPSPNTPSDGGNAPDMPLEQ